LTKAILILGAILAETMPAPVVRARSSNIATDASPEVFFS